MNNNTFAGRAQGWKGRGEVPFRDRTGGVIACYRVEHDHWKNDRALAEARSMGMSWFQTAIQSYVRKYQARDLTAMAPKTLDASAAVLAPAQP